MFYQYSLSEVREKYGNEPNFQNIMWGLTVYNKIQFINSKEFLCEVCLEKIFS